MLKAIQKGELSRLTKIGRIIPESRTSEPDRTTETGAGFSTPFL
jgi:hypothetical protein